MPSQKKHATQRFVGRHAIAILIVLGLTWRNFHGGRNLCVQSEAFSDDTIVNPSRYLEQAKLSAQAWLDFLRSHSENGNTTRTERTGCKEGEYGAQSCVFEGFVCINTTQAQFEKNSRPLVYFVDDTERDGSDVKHDNFCQLRHLNIDPRYYSGRHWPIPTDTVAPLHSCLTAVYRTTRSLFPNSLVPRSTRWLNDLWLFDLDFPGNPHNYHYVKDIVWMLDAVLWEETLHYKPFASTLKLDGNEGSVQHKPFSLFSDGPQQVYMPQTQKQFQSVIRDETNALMLALSLRLDAKRLRSEKSDNLREFSEAYPEMSRRLSFHGDLSRNTSGSDLTCAPRLSSGAKNGLLLHERVCRHLREKSYDLFDIEEIPPRPRGQAYFGQPPKRIVMFHRHITRGIVNIDEIRTAFERTFGPYGVEVEVVTTFPSVKERVRVFSRAGVLFSPHGSQLMGQMWMPRHSALVEVMPVGYTNYMNLLFSEKCKLFYFEIQGNLTETGPSIEDYKTNCKDVVKNRELIVCNAFKSVNMHVPVDTAVKVVRHAFEKMGHAVSEWPEIVMEGGLL